MTELGALVADCKKAPPAIRFPEQLRRPRSEGMRMPRQFTDRHDDPVPLGTGVAVGGI
jgi:hypothetical protein